MRGPANTALPLIRHCSTQSPSIASRRAFVSMASPGRRRDAPRWANHDTDLSSSRPSAPPNTSYPVNSFTTNSFSSSLHPYSPSSPNSRLSLISRHLRRDPVNLELNTPYSTERSSVAEDEFDTLPTSTETGQAETQNEQARDSPTPPTAKMTSKQQEHPTLLIPGPVEYSDEVLDSMSHFSQSHVGPPFVKTFSEVLQMLRPVFRTTNPNSQPFVISGSGTLGWDQVASNLTEPGDNALVLHTGYFGDSFADCLETYGAHATQIKAPIGGRPELPEIEEALKAKKYKIITITHVDTSTGVLSEVKPLVDLVRKVSPETLVVVDGVCSVGAEELHFDDWDLDVVLTGSQKALGCPAGLSILMASERAIKVFKARKTRPNSYFSSWANWLQIMQNYEANKPSYFATPAPQLIHALHTSLKQITAVPLDDRVKRHRQVADRVQAHVEKLGLKQLPLENKNRASTMTAIWLPEGMIAAEFLPGLLSRGTIFAGGLHKEVATKYIRFGHMGVSIMDEKRDDISTALKHLEERLTEVGYKLPN